MAHITLAGARAEFSLGDSVSTMIARFKAWRSYRRTVVELSALTDRELLDIGISRADIVGIARGQIATDRR